MSSRRRLADNVVSLFLLQGLTTLLPLLTVPYLVRTLGQNRFGALSFAVATMQQLVVLTDFGFNFSATRYVAIHRDDAALVNRCFSAVMTAKLGLLSASGLVMALLLWWVPKFHAEWPLFAVSFLMVVGNVLFPYWMFQGLERLRYVAIATSIARIFLTALIFVMVHGPQDVMRAAFLQTSSFLVSAAISLPMLAAIFPLRPRWVGWDAIREHMHDSLHPFLANLMGALIGSSSVMFLGFYKSLDVVGGFAAMEKVARAEVMGFTPVTQALYPYVSHKFSRNHAEGRQSLLRATLILLGIAGVVMGLVAVFAHPLVRLAYGTRLLPYAPVLGWFNLWAFLSLANTMLGVHYLIGAGYADRFGKAVFVAAVVTVGLFLLLIPHTVTGGALTAVIAGEIVQVGMIVVSITRIERKLGADLPAAPSDTGAAV
jgi:PST family polysaccharide transporter